MLLSRLTKRLYEEKGNHGNGNGNDAKEVLVGKAQKHPRVSNLIFNLFGELHIVESTIVSPLIISKYIL